MKPIRLGIASAVAFSILWIICSAIVALMPDAMMAISGHMIHADFTQLGWSLTWTGFFSGLIAWAFVAGVTAWLVALVYDVLSRE